FRAFLSKSTQLIFLCGLILFAILDVYVNYTLILLSECLGLFLFSCFTYGFMKYFRSKTPKVLSLTSIFLTLAVMTRPNLIPLVPVYFMTVFLYMHKHGILSWKAAITNCTICAAGLSILPLRNYIITGNPVLLPVEGMEDTDTELAHLTFQVVLQKLAFCFGYLSGLIPAYKIRIHWMIMWAGY